MAHFITLTTDFGTQDGYVGAMKGTIASIAANIQIIDITHDIAPQSILQAAYCLNRSIPNFPNGTIHIAVVDPGVGSMRSALAIKTEFFWLVGPDNGIFSLLLKTYPPIKIIQIFSQTDYWKTHTSFDGLALFSPVAAHLANGMEIEQIGHLIKDYQKLTLPKAKTTAKGIQGEILLFDRFGNAITNISASCLGTFPNERVFIESHSEISCVLQTHYQAGAQEKHLALINSDQLLELSIFCGNLEKEYGLVVGDKVWVSKENSQ